MGIVDEDIVAVRAASDIVAIITKYTQLRRSGTRWVGLCPFHAEKTGSFSVNQDLGVYRCFGCQASGDVITFVREKEQLDFVDAVELLAGWAGITLRYDDKDQGAGRKRRARLVEAVEHAVAWYHERLLSAPDAAVARKYLRERGLSGDEVRAFQIGWAPEGWDTMVKALRLPDDIVEESGIGFVNRNRRQTDRFRGRILFPIFDANGDAVGFGGRAMPGSEDPRKYINTPETVLYQKSKLLYALNWSKARIVTDDRAIVCEGYTDVIGFARAGLPAAVATCGTALTEEHVRLLRRYARRIVLAFDADAAGQAAAERFYQWERDHELEVAVAALPPGVDPADLAGSDPAALARAVEGAVPFLKFRVDRALGAGSLDTAEGRARAAEAALDVIREHPSDLVRDQYVMEVAGRCRVEPDALRAALRRPAAPRERPAERGPRAAVAPPPLAGRRRHADERNSPELEVLRHVVHQWHEVEPWIRYDDLFASDLHARAFNTLMAYPTVPEAIDAAEPEVAELLTRLATEELAPDPFDAVVRLLTETARREVSSIASRVGAAPDAAELLRLQHWLTQVVDQLRDADTAHEAAEHLVAWLGSRGEEGA